MESNSAAIQVRQLTKRFGRFTAVDQVSFEVGRGEFFGLLGPNGAGKTTLIRMLTTLLLPTSGAALVNGYDVAHQQRQVRESIGVIPQALTSDLELTGWQNIDVYGEYYGLSRRERHRRAEFLLEMVGIKERAREMVKTYSGGMRRRLEIARGLIHSPRVLFLDEPTIGLDPQARRAVWELLARLRRETDITISLTTHYMDEAEQLCDRIAIVDAGKVAAIGSPEQLKRMVPGSDRITLEISDGMTEAMAMLRAQPHVLSVARDDDGAIVISADDGAHLMPAILGRLEAIGAGVKAMRIDRISLEDVFISFTGRHLREDRAAADADATLRAAFTAAGRSR